MKSLKELYRIGKGPSSSHTMGPNKAAKDFAERHLDAASFEVTLYGSLAATGKGHMTDVAIIEVLERIAPVSIVWKPEVFLPYHPNGMCFKSFDTEGHQTDEWTVYSVGGGALSEGRPDDRFLTPDVYEMNRLAEIQKWCEDKGRSYWEYVDLCEGPDIWDYLQEVWEAMKASVERGIDHEGVLPGPLNLPRKAPTYYVKATGYKQTLQTRGLVYAYALAVSEENASGGVIVTAPTCGSSGVMPGVLYHLAKGHEFKDIRVLHALATAGIIGNVVKRNASISGAEVGCQGEVGVACSMAAAGLAAVCGGTVEQIENAAEIGMEHNLGLTCDPVAGQVQIPCIERNAIAAVKAINAARMALRGNGSHYISLDQVIHTMMATGRDMQSKYKETSLGGLAVSIVEC